MPSPEIMEMLTAAGRLRYVDIRRYAQGATASDFAAQFLYPVLVGASLYRGSMETRVGQEATMRFHAADAFNLQDDASTDPHGLKRALFPLIKKPFALPPKEQFTVGRTDRNDLVMVDYTISRKHAQIEIDVTRAKLLLLDLGSVNGTSLNGLPLKPHEPKAFKPGDILGFGRFKFLCMTPTELFVHLRAPPSP